MKKLFLFIFMLTIKRLNWLPRIEAELMYARGFGYDPGVESEVQHAIELIGLSPGSTSDLVVLDVGAYNGDWSAAVLKQLPTCKVHAFEPSPTVKQRLDKRFDNLSRIKTYELGFSNEEGILDLFSNNLDGNMSSLVKRNLDYVEIPFNAQIKVHVKTLSNWCDENGVSPDMLKLDVEGFEYQVLQGSLKYLSKIRLVQFEFGGTDIDSRIFFRDFWNLLATAGFEIYRLTPTGPKKIPTYSERLEVFEFSNYYAVNTK